MNRTRPSGESREQANLIKASKRLASGDDLSKRLAAVELLQCVVHFADPQEVVSLLVDHRS
jgi:hypothetical protein